MKKEKSILSSFKILLKRLSIVLLMMTITRLLFLYFNFDSFTNLGFNEFAVAAWFDCITISLFFLPFILIHSIPVSKKLFRIKELTLLIYFHAINTLMLALNLMDLEYFKFTSKRSTFDLFAILGVDSPIFTGPKCPFLAV